MITRGKRRAEHAQYFVECLQRTGPVALVASCVLLVSLLLPSPVKEYAAYVIASFLCGLLFGVFSASLLCRAIGQRRTKLLQVSVLVVLVLVAWVAALLYL